MCMQYVIVIMQCSHRRDPRGARGAMAPPLFKDIQRIFLLLNINIRIMNLCPPPTLKHLLTPMNVANQQYTGYVYVRIYVVYTITKFDYIFLLCTQQIISVITPAITDMVWSMILSTLYATVAASLNKEISAHNG